MEINLYDRDGRNIAYIDDDTVYLISGEPVATFKRSMIFNAEGDQIGMLDDGWVLDMSGKCVCFSEESTNSPAKKSMKKASHKTKKHRNLRPPHGGRRVIKKSVWSTTPADEFFVEE